MFHPHLRALGRIWVDKEFPSDGLVSVRGVSCLEGCGERCSCPAGFRDGLFVFRVGTPHFRLSPGVLNAVAHQGWLLVCAHEDWDEPAASASTLSVLSTLQ